jgi:hypothetical protein
MAKKVRGELRLWTDAQQAHARIDAQTPAGPVLFQVSVPLAVVRVRVLRALAARNGRAPRLPETTDAMVGLFGRRLALRRLASAVPGAFSPRGLAPHLILKRFAGGTVPGQFLMRSHRLLSPGDRVLSRFRSSLSPLQRPGLSGDGFEGVGYQDSIGVVPVVAAAAASPKVIAGAKLLSAAATNPKALAQVKRITSLAKAGNPAAKSALGTLRKANIFRKRRQAAAVAAKSSTDATALARPALAALPSAGRRTRRRKVVQAVADRGRRFFQNWQRGVE